MGWRRGARIASRMDSHVPLFNRNYDLGLDPEDLVQEGYGFKLPHPPSDGGKSGILPCICGCFQIGPCFRRDRPLPSSMVLSAAVPLRGSCFYFSEACI